MTAAQFDNSNGLQKTMDFATDHSTAFPVLALLFFVCQACVMVAAANFGTGVPLSQRCSKWSTEARWVQASVSPINIWPVIAQKLFLSRVLPGVHTLISLQECPLHLIAIHRVVW